MGREMLRGRDQLAMTYSVTVICRATVAVALIYINQEFFQRGLSGVFSWRRGKHLKVMWSP
jgi:hypothetical protein